MKLTYDVANAGFEIASSLNPMGAPNAAMAFMQISKNLHATAKSVHVSFASWEKPIEDQDELQNGNRFKAIPVEVASVTCAEEVK
jgi:hypothetical protein